MNSSNSAANKNLYPQVSEVDIPIFVLATIVSDTNKNRPNQLPVHNWRQNNLCFLFQNHYDY